MFLQAVGDERLPVSLGLNVKGMVGIEDRSLAERYEKHIGVCKSAIEQSLNTDCAELIAQVRRFPKEFDKTHNLPVIEQSVAADANTTVLLKPAGPAATVAEPSLPPNLSGYRYLTLTHEGPLINSGTLTVTIKGVKTDITLTVAATPVKITQCP